MTQVANNGSLKTRRANDHQAVLAAIDEVIDLCKMSGPDAAIDKTIRELHAIKSAVQTHWPLRSDLKKKIDLGPFAAKNISDWNSTLADVLMRLDYSLQHDGKAVDRVVPALPKAQVQLEAAALG